MAAEMVDSSEVVNEQRVADAAGDSDASAGPFFSLPESPLRRRTPREISVEAEREGAALGSRAAVGGFGVS